MSTIREIQFEIGEKVVAVKTEGKKAVCEKLKELNLDRLVKRKRDGVIGEIKAWDYNDLRFYPLKKDGLPSAIASGYIWKVEEEYEPYEEAR